MARIGPEKYQNALTDNGVQFKSKNKFWAAYREGHVRKKHIHCSVRHPETLGKLSAYQKGLKKFVKHHLGGSRNRARMAKLIDIYNLYVNNAKQHSSTGKVPEEAYSGIKTQTWFFRLVREFGLEEVLFEPENDFQFTL